MRHSLILLGGIEYRFIYSKLNRMTIEQLQQISERSMIASKANDIDTQIKLPKIMDTNIHASEFKPHEGSEWFDSLLTEA